MRWKSLFGGLALLLASAVGCKQQYFLTESDWNHLQDTLTRSDVEIHSDLGAAPLMAPTGPPSTILDPEREIRFISMAEALCIAMEQGTIGNQQLAFQQLQGGEQGILVQPDQPVTGFSGTAAANGLGIQDTTVRAFALDPAAVGSLIEESLSKFDAVWTNSANWTTTDRPVGTPLDTFQATSNGTVLNAINQQAATISTGVLKPLPTGGLAGVTFSTAYTDTNLPARVNPAYQPTLQFQFEQPLLQGFGTEINQISASHPALTSILNPGVFSRYAPGLSEGILVTRIRFDQQRAEFERLLNYQALNVELAYWNLYYSYWDLYAAEQGVRQSFEAWKIAVASFQAGRLAIADVAQARSQYENYRGRRINALYYLLDNERVLRAMLGMTVEDGTRLVPSDKPTLAPYNPDWGTAMEEALACRPELIQCRDDVKAQQLRVLAIKNQLLPDLRLAATYDINALGGQLDGPGSNNAIRQLASNHFNNWALTLQMNVPIGYRNVHAQVRFEQLRLQRAYWVLDDQEKRIVRVLAQQYRRISANYELIRVNRAQREPAAEQLKARFQGFLAGRKEDTLDKLLEAQRLWADALNQEYAAIRDYNNALAGFEASKGTILRRNNVTIAEGPLPSAAQRRAVEHLRERNKSIILAERSLTPTGTGTGMGIVPASVGAPATGAETPSNDVPSVASMLLNTPPLKDVPVLPTNVPPGGPLPVLPVSTLKMPQPTTVTPPARPPVADAPGSPAAIKPSSQPGLLPLPAEMAASKPSNPVPVPAGTVALPPLSTTPTTSPAP